MYPTSPEDRLLQVRHSQDELRAHTAAERFATAAGVERTAEAAGVTVAGAHALLERTRHVLRAISWPHVVAGHRAR